MITEYFAIALGVVALVLIVLANIFQIVLYGKVFNETMQAVDFCYTLFEIATLAAFIFLAANTFAAVIGLFALILTGIVTVGYKTYYTIKYTDLISKIKKLFRRN